MQFDFPDLLDQHMRRIRASASAVAIEIGMSREAVNNWRRGYSKPSKKHRNKVVACSNYLRLSESECNELLASVGFNDEFALYEDTKSNALETIFQQLEQSQPYPILLVLSQAHIDQPPQKQMVIEQAKLKYPEKDTLHLQLPFSEKVTVAAFFQFIGSQLNLSGVEDELGFEFKLSDVLQRKPITLVISRFEQGNQQCREMLAGILRNLCEMYPGRLNVILCGGADLSALKYAQGDLSLLNIATSYLYQFNLADWLKSQKTDTTFLDDNTTAKDLLFELIGNHPALVSSLYQQINQNKTIDEMKRVIANSDMLYCDFNQVVQTAGLKALQKWLSEKNLGSYRPHLHNDTLRKLFWLNLIRKDDNNNLVWQSEPIRNFGIKMVTELSG